jgi:hypothetical protein
MKVSKTHYGGSDVGKELEYRAVGGLDPARSGVWGGRNYEGDHASVRPCGDADVIGNCSFLAGPVYRNGGVGRCDWRAAESAFRFG